MWSSFKRSVCFALSGSAHVAFNRTVLNDKQLLSHSECTNDYSLSNADSHSLSSSGFSCIIFGGNLASTWWATSFDLLSIGAPGDLTLQCVDFGIYENEASSVFPTVTVFEVLYLWRLLHFSLYSQVHWSPLSSHRHHCHRCRHRPLYVCHHRHHCLLSPLSTLSLCHHCSVLFALLPLFISFLLNNFYSCLMQLSFDPTSLSRFTLASPSFFSLSLYLLLLGPPVSAWTQLILHRHHTHTIIDCGDPCLLLHEMMQNVCEWAQCHVFMSNGATDCADVNPGRMMWE